MNLWLNINFKKNRIWLKPFSKINYHPLQLKLEAIQKAGGNSKKGQSKRCGKFKIEIYSKINRIGL
jgi:hypothetical protein